MCGFAGVVAWDERYRTSRETLARMSAAIAHRGPDGEGAWFNHEAEITPDRPQVALAHRRLAIIDPDPRGNQPFTDGQGRWIVFNGEIYNFRELRQELKSLKPEYEWRTNCDTEVLLIAYVVWGEKCVERVNGMFAFAVWDENEKSLYLARDRMGQKPLYFAYVTDSTEYGLNPAWPGQPLPAPQAIVFASELPAMRVHTASASTPLDLCSLTEYLQLGYLATGRTIWEGIHHLAPAAHITVAGQSLETKWYWPGADWRDERQPAPLSDAEAVAQMRSRMDTAVTRQLVSDVPIGCLLSGGIDSSVVAAAMKRAVGSADRVHTFSIAFSDPRYDESEYAARVAEHLGTSHHRFTVTPDAAADLPKLAAVFGEPFGDSSALPTHYLARETRQHVKVALGGDGGDELFGGYERYRAMRLSRRLRRVSTPLPWWLVAPAARRLARGHPKSRLTRLGRFLGGLGLSASTRYSSYMRLFDGDLIVALMGHLIATARAWGPTHNDRIRNYWGIPRHNFSGSPTERIRDEVRAAMASDRLLYLPGDLLTKIDRASMLHALEVRSPFMDHELVQFAAGLTTDQLLKGGPKRMLREAFAEDLPAWVFKRKKMGFAVPIGDWFRGELRPMLRDHLFATDSFCRQHFQMKVVERLVDEHETQRVDHSQRLYALLMLELWWRLR